MALLTALSLKQHGKLHVSGDSAVEFAKDKHMLAIRVTEVSPASASFPVFVTRQTNGDLSLSAVTSFQAGQNLFVKDKAWDSIFQSTTMKAYPIFLMRSDDGGPEPVLGIDGAANLRMDGGKALFDPSGKPALWLSQMRAMLTQDAQNSVHSREFCKTLNDLKLTRALNLTLSFEDGDSSTITGLHTINEDVLQTLSSEKLIELRDRGYLAPIYAMLSSVQQLNALIRRHNALKDYPTIKRISLEVVKPNI